MGLESESFLALYRLGNPGCLHHLCVGVDNYNPDLLAERLSDHGVQANINRDPANRTSGGDQLYFNDPDGILVQLLSMGTLADSIRPAASAILLGLQRRSRCHKGFSCLSCTGRKARGFASLWLSMEVGASL